MKKILKFILTLLMGLAAILGVFILFVHLTNYKPKDIEPLPIKEGNNTAVVQTETPYSILTWNTGYAALGKDQDFFMDGGKKSGADSKEEVLENLSKMNVSIEEINADFVFLQEVDEYGKRSKNIDQIKAYEREHYYHSFATNYKTVFVPVPVTSPMGGVHSGIMTQSKIKPESATRYSLEGKETFIVQLFDLNRAFTISRYPVNGKELVLINTHFSAFDKGGKIREQQLNQIKKVLADEYSKGNYVILGGDFNHELPGTSSDNFTWTVPLPDWIQKFPTDFNLNNYNWAVDPTIPTVRSNEQAYVKGENFVAIIDGFLVSDNIEIKNVRNFDFNFENTDHNPVYMQFILK